MFFFFHKSWPVAAHWSSSYQMLFLSGVRHLWYLQCFRYQSKNRYIFQNVSINFAPKHWFVWPPSFTHHHELQLQLQKQSAVTSLTISRAISSLCTGSRSGTVKDSGKVAPRARASAAFTVVEKQSNQDHSLAFQTAMPDSGGQCRRLGGTGGRHRSWSRWSPTAREARHCM